MAEMNQAQREEELARREALLAQREAQLEKEQAELAAAKAQSAERKKRPCWTTTTRILSTPRKSSTINSPSRSTRWTSSLGCCLPSFFCFWCWA